jgi:hypothetical protein
MFKAINLFVWSFSAIVIAHVLPADARRLPDRIDAAQLKKGLAAFSRQDYTAAGLLLRAPAEHGNSNAQAVLCFLYTHGRGVPQSYSEAAHCSSTRTRSIRHSAGAQMSEYRVLTGAFARTSRSDRDAGGPA